VLVKLVPGRLEQAMPYYEPLFHGTVRLLESYSDDDIQLIVDFLEQGREMVELELEKLERAAEKPAG
jgi:hypothetical protein